ncbi:hypothetical protein EBH_0037200 [Eimeria brunetti]|uniref:Reverse transcriptase domain-containing protein n=1 Tax=Eimeria brunetti TaxID=51314 RepID=U6LNN0_9EIME|nr:hypothetical protein EBH_0037200 [Eimeria brunetti]
MPSKGVLYRLNKDELEPQREIIQNLKNGKWITITSSPFAAPAMVVGKMDDGSGKQQYRMVINYQELNAITISPEYPLPGIQDILDLLHGAKVFRTMDMEQGFHQIPMAPEDQHKTAFRTCMGEYEFKVKTTKPIRPRVARWLEFLMDFQDLKVEYRPGANNVVADALSRCPYYQPVEAETLRDAANDTTEVGNCFLVQATDEDLQEYKGADALAGG